MEFWRRIARYVSPVLMLGVLVLSLESPAAQAAAVSTQAVLDAQALAQERAVVRGALERADVAQALTNYGVRATDVQARVDGLSDTEVHTLATHIEQMPAAGDDPLGLLVFVFLVLLITDIAGLTDVFPFVKKHRR